MMITIAVGVGAACLLLGAWIGMSIGHQERGALWEALREWAAAERAVARATYTKRIPAERRLARAEAVLRSLIAEDDIAAGGAH